MLTRIDIFLNKRTDLEKLNVKKSKDRSRENLTVSYRLTCHLPQKELRRKTKKIGVFFKEGNYLNLMNVSMIILLMIFVLSDI